MQDLSQLKTMIDTLQRRRLGFKKQIDEFKTLQGEIAQLHARAATDPEAQQKLKKLDTVLKGDRLPNQLSSKVDTMKKTFDQLGKQLKQLIPDEQKAPVAVASVAAAAEQPKLAKKHRRSFA